jgi:predicted P-loop ATPase
MSARDALNSKVAALGGADAVLKDAAPLPLRLDGNNKPPSNLLNHEVAISHLYLGRIRYDVFLQEIRFGRPGEDRGWTENDSLELTAELQARGFHKATDELTAKAVRLIAQRNQSDSLKAWLESLQWDGTPRIDRWLVDAFGTADDTYHRQVGSNMLLGMAARGLYPGCKLDTMPIFEGRQGIKKSATARALAGPDWFAEMLASPDDKDFFLTLRGKWLIELAELDAFNKASVVRIKQVLSSASDRYRAPYEKAAIDVPRRAVFVGTTNEDAYLRDETGARRFWPVACKYASPDWVEQHREQLFAEAVARLAERRVWWEIDTSAAATQAELRRIQHPWEEALKEKLLGKSSITSGEALELLGVETGRRTRAQEMAVAEVLKALGWQQGARVNNKRVWRPSWAE